MALLEERDEPMKYPNFTIRDRILAVPIVLAALVCVFMLADGSAVVIPSASMGMMIIAVLVSLWLFPYFYRRARPVHRLSLVLGLVALFIHPKITSEYAEGWCADPDVIVSKGVEKEIPAESVLKAKIARATNSGERSFWTNRLIQHLYINDLWKWQRDDHMSYMLYQPSVVLVLLAIFIGCLSPAGDSVLIEVFNPHRREHHG